MTIRLRLTLLFVALFAALVLLRDVTVLTGFSHTLTRMSEADARNKAQQIADYLRDLKAEHRREGRQLELQSFDALPRAFSDDGSYLQISDDAGQPLNKSPNLGTQALPFTRNPSLSEVDFLLHGAAEPARLVVATLQVTLPPRPTPIWIQAAYPLQNNNRVLKQLLGLILAGWAGAVAVAVIVGYAFAGRALRPVAEMTERVRAMQSRDLHLRLPTKNPPQDEIDHLGATFNELFVRLESAFEGQRRFVADASHELRTPLTTITGNLQLIRRRGEDHPEEAKHWADVALREADRLKRLVNDLLELARAGEGKLTLAHAPLDLAGLARDVAHQFHVVAPRVRVAGEGPVMITGDADRLRQVVINLVDNAVRATRESGDVTIVVTHEAGGARLSVIDTGIGIAPEAQTKLFDRFFRVDSARDRQTGGTGLGLPIAAALVEGHGGTLTVDSALGAGATFHVRIPDSGVAG